MANQRITFGDLPAIDVDVTPFDGAEAIPLMKGGVAYKTTVEDITAVVGALAATAVQPGDLHAVATTGLYTDLSGTPVLGSASAENVGAFATAAQGTLADSAVQPGDMATVATTGAYTDLSGLPTLGTAAAADTGDFATAAQGATADAALPRAGGTVTGTLKVTHIGQDDVTPVDVVTVERQTGGYGSTAVTLNGGNRTNQPVLKLENIGQGNGGLEFAFAGGGYYGVNLSGGSVGVVTQNRSMFFSTDNNAYDSGSTYGFFFSSVSKPAANTAFVVRGHAGITAPIQAWWASDNTVMASVNADGGATFTGGVDLDNADSSALTDLLINPAVKTSGQLIDAQVGGVSKFKVDNTGLITLPSGGSSVYSIQSAGANLTLYASNAVIFNRSSGNYGVNIDHGASRLSLYANYMLSFSTGNSGPTIALSKNSDDALEVNSTVAGTYRDLKLRTLVASAVDLSESTPATPPANTVRLFGKKIAGAMFPAFKGPSGIDSALQPLLARNKVGYWNPPGNATVVPGVFGFTAPTVTGFTATTRSVATTNLFTRMRRLGYVTTAAVGAVGNWRVAVYQYTTGGVSGLGGFRYIKRFGISDAADVAGARMFIGMRASATPANVEPNTLTNCIGLGHGAADTNMMLFYGGSAAQTPIDLGVNFPLDRNTTPYELALFSAAAASDVHWQVTNLATGATTSGTISGATTVVPGEATLLAPWGYRTNNATALAVGLDVMSAYIETDS